MKTGIITVLAILLTAMLLMVMPAIAQEEGIPVINLHEGDVLLAGEEYGLRLEPEITPTNSFVIIGIVAEGESVAEGTWQIANDGCEPGTFVFFVEENISPGEYDVKVVVFDRSEYCYFLSCYETVTIENITVVAISDYY